MRVRACMPRRSAVMLYLGQQVTGSAVAPTVRRLQINYVVEAIRHMLTALAKVPSWGLPTRPACDAYVAPVRFR